MSWKIVGASAQGTTHAANNQECQDANAFCSVGSWFVGVVCDGAGTARFAAIGARHGARTVVERIAAHLASAPLPGSDGPPLAGTDQARIGEALAGGTAPLVAETNEALIDEADEALRSVVIEAVALARDTVLAPATEEGVTLADFNATLVGCVGWHGGGLLFHIGDGAAVALDATSLHVLAISPPENGEFAEQTFFYTGSEWREHLRFTPVPLGANLIALMSDGAMTFGIAANRRDVDRRFFGPVTRFLSRDGVSPQAGSAALLATLSSPGACRVTHDDKTLLWAYWSTGDAPESETVSGNAEESRRTGE